MMVLFNIDEKIVKGRRAMKLGRLEELVEKEDDKLKKIIKEVDNYDAKKHVECYL